MSPNARTYYAAEIAQFASSSIAAILGNLAANTDFDIELAQRNAWSEQIPILKTALSGIEGSIFLEFVVPRIGSRIDAVLVSGPVLFVIEFKVGAEAFSRDDLNQVWDYALDLKNFHRESDAAAIVPILVATHASRSDVVLREAYSDGVYPPVTSNRDGLSHLLVEGLRSVKGTPIGGMEQGPLSADLDDYRGRSGTLFTPLSRGHLTPRRGCAQSAGHVTTDRRTDRGSEKRLRRIREDAAEAGSRQAANRGCVS